MIRATRVVEYAGQRERILCLSFELGLKEWKLGFTTDLGAHQRIQGFALGS